jgi:hypothetical protein
MSNLLHQHLLAVSEELQCAHRVSRSYGNTGGKGDMRETALRDWLGEFLSARLAISKGEIVDSSGRRSREFDCIVHLPSLAPRIFGRAGRLLGSAFSGSVAVTPVGVGLFPGIRRIPAHCDR